MGALLSKIRDRMRRAGGRIDQYHEAITFAEAGEDAPARKLATKEVVETEERPGKLLVMGRESNFSREIIDYALEMAKRMSYEILALNTAPLSCETFQLFSSSRNKLCNEFRTIAAENARAFQKEAEELGIPFHHVVKFSDPDEALEEIKKEYNDIEFVVSDSEEDQASNRVEDRERARHEIFVYSVV